MTPTILTPERIKTWSPDEIIDWCARTGRDPALFLPPVPPAPAQQHETNHD